MEPEYSNRSQRIGTQKQLCHLMDMSKAIREHFKVNLAQKLNIQTTHSRGNGYDGENLIDGDYATY